MRSFRLRTPIDAVAALVTMDARLSASRLFRSSLDCALTIGWTIDLRSLRCRRLFLASKAVIIRLQQISLKDGYHRRDVDDTELNGPISWAEMCETARHTGMSHKTVRVAPPEIVSTCVWATWLWYTTNTIENSCQGQSCCTFPNASFLNKVSQVGIKWPGRSLSIP